MCEGERVLSSFHVLSRCTWDDGGSGPGRAAAGPLARLRAALFGGPGSAVLALGSLKRLRIAIQSMVYLSLMSLFSYS